ncbi:YlxR family protein [Helicobacter felis]|uniref:Nucleic acid binding transriptional terminator n=1 Tax=Helicobacter felis (strain ATCC 49179 / CCUG 28539 / NCTC 12436 / CS1) TaxID=936155 RepID=E7A9I9_HELFC|nr:DUF448 domain-containing protein [Helicobacter felis]CBY82515.1 Nucleic acid binding transriptional terminator [Helicobacter felis ATCC 49179]
MQIKGFFSKNAVRMCVCCRERALQENLLRFSIQEGKIISFCGQGRSFYLCKTCLYAKDVCRQILKVKHAPKNKAYIGTWLEEVRAS